ncbi:MAG: aromatic amino acid ammonia-lyase [Actinomycetes bacterium]
MASPHTRAFVVLDGRALTCESVARIARTDVSLRLDSNARRRAEESWSLARRRASERPVYGRTTGVGANRVEVAGEGDLPGHGLRLLNSHAGGMGPLVSDELARAMLAVRLNQLAAGGAGLSPAILEGLAAALSAGAVPAVHRYGAIGTGDLTALAETALTLSGARPWRRGLVDPVTFGTGDALAFLSSNALTVAEAALGCVELARLVEATQVVTALSFVALSGSWEALAPQVHAARPHPGQVACAATMRRLLGLDEAVDAFAPGRLQDPFGLRVFPQMHGPALDALAALDRVLTVEINAATENPLVSLEADDVLHHGNFHLAALTLALDQAHAAAHHTAQLSVARLGDLVEPQFTGQPAFLAGGPSGSSGVMILEYLAHDALAQMRSALTPLTTGTVVISRGLEDHASFASQAARQTESTVAAFRIVLGCELVAAVRALRMQRRDLPDVPVRAAFERAAAALPADLSDRPLGDDVEMAGSLLPALADLAAPG